MYQRPLRLPDELPIALALADHSSLSFPHRADWPYRFASWGLDDLENTRGWFDDSGHLLGWSALQTPFWAIDAVVHPQAPITLYRELLTWATARTHTLRVAGGGRPIWFVSIAATCDSSRQDLDRLGFVDISEAAEDAWSKLLFALPREREVPSPPLPEGMRIRSLRVPEEIEAYVVLHREVFRSDSMTTAWRARTTQMLGYHNALDLVLTSDTDALCGFCVAWLRVGETGEPVGQIEPLGITKQYRGRRLSQALLAEAVQRLRSSGARQVYVETDQQRTSVMAAYAAMGFELVHQIRVYRYDVPDPPPQLLH